MRQKGAVETKMRGAGRPIETKGLLAQADREELAKWRRHPPAGKGAGGGGKGKNKMQGKNQSGEEICFSWAKDSGPCAGLSPGSECKAKVKRAHISAKFVCHLGTTTPSARRSEFTRVWKTWASPLRQRWIEGVLLKFFILWREREVKDSDCLHELVEVLWIGKRFRSF
jgi:hypothetical protein